MTLAQEFARRLRQERRRKAYEQEADISWEDVATAVGLSGAAISRYVKGRVIPDDTILQRLADYFGVRRVWLREGEGQRASAIPGVKQMDMGKPIEPADLREATPIAAAASDQGRRGRARPASAPRKSRGPRRGGS